MRMRDQEAEALREHDNNYEAREAARHKYRPEKIRCLLIVEAPPDALDRFFYFEDVQEMDYLYIETMKVIYGNVDVSGLRERKVEFLQGFMENGFYLIDAVNDPIGNDASSHQTKEIVLNSRQDLVERMRTLVTEETRVILIKASVYKLRDALIDDGFNVLNDCMIEFPCCGN
ncbi:MAG: hypothetical protein ABR986_10485 [Methanomassiliicoccales archaeon]|jgi:hypothetical protein